MAPIFGAKIYKPVLPQPNCLKISIKFSLVKFSAVSFRPFRFGRSGRFVSVVSFRSFRWFRPFRFGRFVSTFRLLVHAQAEAFHKKLGGGG